MLKIRLADIERGDFANGLGRMGLTLWFQGCSIGCEGCHNPRLIPNEGGQDYDVEFIVEKIKKNRHWLEKGIVIFLGGEPTDQLPQLQYINAAIRSMGIETLLYTGRTEQELADMGVMVGSYSWAKVGRFNLSQKTHGEPLASSNQYYLRNGERVHEDEFIIRERV